MPSTGVILEAELRKRIADLELALKCIIANAAFEQERPTGLGMTCLSIIEREARKALAR